MPRDLYWPHVGQENNTIGHTVRFVGADGARVLVSASGARRARECQITRMDT